MDSVSSRPAPQDGNQKSQKDVEASHANEAIKTGIAKIVIDNVLIWLFWGSADYFAGHGHPLLSDICFFLFYAALTATFAIILNTLWRWPKTLFAASIVACSAVAWLIFGSRSLPAISSDTRLWLAVIASFATTIMWYRSSRKIIESAEWYRIEAERLRKELQAKHAEVCNGLGSALTAAIELAERRVKNDSEYETWKADANSWFEATQRFIYENLSPAELAVFQDGSNQTFVMFSNCFDERHNTLLNRLKGNRTSLRGILERHLGQKSHGD